MNEPSLSFVFSLDCCPALRKMLMGALLKFYREGRRSVPLRGSANRSIQEESHTLPRSGTDLNLNLNLNLRFEINLHVATLNPVLETPNPDVRAIPNSSTETPAWDTES